MKLIRRCLLTVAMLAAFLVFETTVRAIAG